MSWPQRTLTKKTLAIQLHGTLLTQVNAGPLAVAQTFLAPAVRESFQPELTDRMDKVFVFFVKLLADALNRQKPLIDTHEIPIQTELERSYFDFKAEVCKLTNTPPDNFYEVFSPADPILSTTPSQPLAPDSPLTTKKQQKKPAANLPRSATKEKKEKDDKRDKKKTQESRVKKQVKTSISVGAKSPRVPKQ